MGKVIDFPKPKPTVDPEIVKLKEVSDSLDEVILNAVLEKQVDPREVAGLLAHRLGSIMRKLESKDDLWDVCERVAKRQAALDSEA